MRTVSFSSDPVRNKLNNNFVCHVINTEGDPSAGASAAHAPTDKPGVCTEGVGNQNVQMLFLTPAGKVFHTASGFRGPETALKELEFAEDLFRKIRTQPQRAEQVVRTEHRERMLKDGFKAETLDRPSSPQNGLTDMFSGMQIPFVGNPQAMGNFMKSGFGNFNPQDMSDGIFSPNTRYARLRDYRFAKDHPMMPIDELQKNPRVLVGNTASVFVSGPSSGGAIGGNARPNAKLPAQPQFPAQQQYP